MPTKLKPSVKRYDRRTGLTSIEHYYIKNIKKEDLFKELNSSNIKPKLRQKIYNELRRRDKYDI